MSSAQEDIEAVNKLDCEGRTGWAPVIEGATHVACKECKHHYNPGYASASGSLHHDYCDHPDTRGPEMISAVNGYRQRFRRLCTEVNVDCQCKFFESGKNEKNELTRDPWPLTKY